MKKNISHPASILHPDRHVQSEHALNSLTIYLYHTCTHVFHATFDEIYDVARYEAYGEEDEDRQDKERGDNQQ